MDWTPREVYELREQREEARDEIKKLKREVINWKTAHDIAIEQRDRLAEALERILSYQGRFSEEDPESIAAEALTAVKGGSHEISNS